MNLFGQSYLDKDGADDLGARDILMQIGLGFFWIVYKALAAWATVNAFGNPFRAVSATFYDEQIIKCLQ